MKLGESSKTLKFDHSIDEDRISDLPELVHAHIISFLPMKDAVRTTILSRKWYTSFLYSSIPNLDFDDVIIGLNTDMFIELVDKVISLRGVTDIKSFKLAVKFEWIVEWIPMDIVRKWVSYAIANNVQNLELIINNMFDMDSVELPCDLFVSKSLTELKLDLNRRKLHFPPDIQLCNLKTLILRRVRFKSDDLVGKLLSNCPLLENLTLQELDLKYIKTLTIRHSKLQVLLIKLCYRDRSDWELKLFTSALRMFDYDGKVAREFRIGELPSLLCANLYFAYYKGCIVKLLTAFSNVETLTLPGLVLEGLPDYPGILASLPAPPFPGVKTLNFENVSKSHLDGLVFLLRFCVTLQSLHICFGSLIISGGGKWILHDSVSFCMCHLENVFIKDYQGSPSEINLMKFLLESAIVLKKVHILISGERNQSLDMELQIRNLAKVSPCCKIVFEISKKLMVHGHDCMLRL